jgi:mono/diheme cytochrome c family protein
MPRIAALTAATFLSVAALALTGCGSQGPSRTDLRTEGRAVFMRYGCAGCHTLRAANARGTIGPNFDTSEKLTRPQIIQQLNAGTGGMPSFRERLSERQKKAVAEFLYSATHRR